MLSTEQLEARAECRQGTTAPQNQAISAFPKWVYSILSTQCSGPRTDPDSYAFGRTVLTSVGDEGLPALSTATTR